MSSFTRAAFEFTGQTVRGRATYCFTEDFVFDIGFIGSGLAVRISAGEVTDGPSVPFWALPFMPVGAMVKAAAVHDKLFADRRFTTLEAAAIFLTAMQAEGTPAWAREIAFLAVRLHRRR